MCKAFSQLMELFNCPKTNQEKLAVLRKELEASESECHKLDMKLELRRKQFHLLVSSIQGLQQLLNDDETSQS